MINIVSTEREHLEDIAKDIRAIDALEMKMFLGLEPLEALEFIYRNAQGMFTVLHDGVPALIFGYNVTDLLFKVAAPFMIATNRAAEYPMVYGRLSKRIIQSLEGYYLVNFVNVDNHLAIKWLEWLRFHVAEPQSYQGVAMVRRFSKDCR